LQKRACLVLLRKGCGQSLSLSDQVDEAAEKLDSMMTQVFQFISNCCLKGQLGATWQALLDSFFATVLNTHRSKFTQFLLWQILHQVSESPATPSCHHPTSCLATRAPVEVCKPGLFG